MRSFDATLEVINSAETGPRIRTSEAEDYKADAEEELKIYLWCTQQYKGLYVKGSKIAVKCNVDIGIIWY